MKMFSRGFLPASVEPFFGLFGVGRKESRPNLADFRRLALQLHYDLPRVESGRSVLLVTPAQSHVPAYAGTLLAQCLAEELRAPILIVEACRGASDLTRAAAAEHAAGLADHLDDPSVSIDSLVLPTRQENVWLLPAGRRRAACQAHAGQNDTRRTGIPGFLCAAAAKFDFVVLAGGPVLHDSLGLGMAPHVGCVLLTAVEHQTRLEDLDAAQRSLAFCRPRKIGLLLTLPVRADLDTL